jgi:serine/threonine protein phosphatase PrpC
MDQACQHCGHPAGQAAFCEACGRAHAGPQPAAAAPKASMSCSCDAPDFDASGFCGECGMKRAAVVPEPWPARHGQRVNERLATLSDIGRRHESNQDAGRVSRVGERVLMAVCDGVSSSQNAERASRAACDAWIEAAQAALEAGFDPERAALLGSQAAHRGALGVDWDPSERLAEPETTLVAAIVEAGRCCVAWVGDSRAYALGPQPRQLTVDDSWIVWAVEAGMDKARAEADSRAHAITQCLGMREMEPVFHVETFELEAGASLLLCSDGMWNDFSDAHALGALIENLPDAGAACETLVQAANAAGGHDNITVALWRP